MTQEMVSREEIDGHLNGIETMRATTGGGMLYIDASELERLCFAADAYHDQKEINNELYEALDQVQQQCLFDDDNGQIGVTEDPCIPAELFNKICLALARAKDGS